MIFFWLAQTHFNWIFVLFWFFLLEIPNFQIFNHFGFGQITQKKHKQKWRNIKEKKKRLLWHFVLNRVNQLILFVLFVLRISISEFQHLKRWQSNNQFHVMLTPNRRKKTKIVIFYFHMILVLLFFLAILLILFTVSTEEDSLFTTLYTSLQLYTELFGSWGSS